MCSPDLKVKAKKAMDVFLSDDTDEKKDDKEENPRDRLKVMTYITGQTAANDARYLRATP